LAYSAEISVESPALLVFVIGQSGSTIDRLEGNEAVRKSDFVVDTVNLKLQDLVIKCAKSERVRNYYYISIIRYGSTTRFAFSGVLSGRSLVPISDVAENPIRTEMRTWIVPDPVNRAVNREIQVPMPIWVESRPDGRNQMCAAFSTVEVVLEEWLSRHPTGFPPIILHLTDCESADGDPTRIGKHITAFSSDDGQVLLFNCHVSRGRILKLEYPLEESALPSEFARTLFNISSPLPDLFLKAARQMGFNIAKGARCFVFNGDAASVGHFVNIGTNATNELLSVGRLA
jgi:hypothetical protein